MLQCVLGGVVGCRSMIGAGRVLGRSIELSGTMSVEQSGSVGRSGPFRFYLGSSSFYRSEVLEFAISDVRFQFGQKQM